MDLLARTHFARVMVADKKAISVRHVFQNYLVEGKPGFNGLLRILGRQVSSQCLPKNGSPIQSRLKDPVKKQAQALHPASNWSGLMQRYVAAVYGGNQVKYSATATALTIAGITINVTSSIGLTIISGRLGFIQIDEGTATLRRVKPKNPCVASALDFWASMSEDDDEERARKNKVLTIALSGCKIGSVVATCDIAATGNRHFTSRAAWVFAHDAATAVAVLEKDGTATAYEATFTFEDGDAVLVDYQDYH